MSRSHSRRRRPDPPDPSPLVTWLRSARALTEAVHDAYLPLRQILCDLALVSVLGLTMVIRLLDSVS